MILHSKRSDSEIILRILKFALILLLIGLALFGTLKVLPYLLTFFWSMLLAEAAVFFSKSIYSAMDRIKPCKTPRSFNQSSTRRLSVTIYFLLVIAATAAMVWSAVSGVQTLSNIARHLPHWLRSGDFVVRLQQVIDGISDNPAGTQVSEFLDLILQKAMSAAPSVAKNILGGVSAFLNSMPMNMLVILIVIMIGYYYINSGPFFYRSALGLVKNKLFVRRVFTLIHSVIQTLFRICGSYIVLMLLTFTESLIGFLIVGVPNAWLLALVCAVVDVLPILGIAVTIMPIAAYFALKGAFLNAIGMIILYLIMTVVRRAVEPLILGTAMSLHPLATMSSMMFGIMFYGLKGVLVGPIFLVLMREILIIFKLKTRLSNFLNDLLPKDQPSGLANTDPDNHN